MSENKRRSRCLTSAELAEVARCGLGVAGGSAPLLVPEDEGASDSQEQLDSAVFAASTASIRIQRSLAASSSRPTSFACSDDDERRLSTSSSSHGVTMELRGSRLLDTSAIGRWSRRSANRGSLGPPWRMAARPTAASSPTAWRPFREDARGDRTFKHFRDQMQASRSIRPIAAGCQDPSSWAVRYT